MCEDDKVSTRESFEAEVSFGHLHRSVAKEIQIHIFPKKISLWMGCVKLFSTHEKMTGKIISCNKDIKEIII